MLPVTEMGVQKLGVGVGRDRAVLWKEISGFLKHRLSKGSLSEMGV